MMYVKLRCRLRTEAVGAALDLHFFIPHQEHFPSEGRAGREPHCLEDSIISLNRVESGYPDIAS